MLSWFMDCHEDEMIWWNLWNYSSCMQVLIKLLTKVSTGHFKFTEYKHSTSVEKVLRDNIWILNNYFCWYCIPQSMIYQSILPWPSILSVAFIYYPFNTHLTLITFFYLELCLHSCIKSFEWRHVCENFP